MKAADYLKVFITTKEPTCDECGVEMPRKSWITLTEGGKAACLSCADLDHLLYLPSGNTALTRRAAKNSALAAVVLKFSRTRRRHERQGMLVEEAALEQAEEECLADSESRARQRRRAAERRARLDQEYVRDFAAGVLNQYPCCPKKIARQVAEHACLKHSGRVGRSAAAKAFDETAIKLAVVAHVRHCYTPYDHLLARGFERFDARRQVAEAVDRQLEKWASAK